MLKNSCLHSHVIRLGMSQKGNQTSLSAMRFELQLSFPWLGYLNLTSNPEGSGLMSINSVFLQK